MGRRASEEAPSTFLHERLLAPPVKVRGFGMTSAFLRIEWRTLLFRLFLEQAHDVVDGILLLLAVLILRLALLSGETAQDASALAIHDALQKPSSEAFH